jgi:N-formylglutamate deformylase
MRLPLLVSVPHAGLDIPAAAAPYCVLTRQQIAEDGDEGAAEIYDIEDEVEAFHTTSVARAIVDLNRAEDDRGKDGVVKTHTCWEVPVYDPFPPEAVVRSLLDTYHRPYHVRLRELASTSGARLGVDCHTMVAFGPPVSPDPGAERPWVCLSNGDGTCPQEWMEGLRRSFEKAFGGNVRVNDPFRGGYITRTHAAEMPWVQLELSRAPFLSNVEKRGLVLQALRDFSL